MGLPPKKRRISVEEYLRLEQNSDVRHELDDGQVLAMSDGSFEHSRITSNFNRALGNALVGKPCYALDSNLKVGIPQLGKFVYPDVLAVCGPPQFDPRDKSRQSIINPRMIVEVLSPTTEAYDRGGKFSKYRMLEAFHEYVLVTQDCALIETFFRQPDGVWLFAPVAGIDGVVKLRSVGVELRLLDIYQGVDFPAAPEPSTDELALDQPG